MRDPSRRTLKIAAASAFLLTLVWQHVQATRLGYQVQQSRRKIHVLEGQISSLDMKIETSLAPAQLAQRARTKLGMQPASPDCLRVLGGPTRQLPPSSLLDRLLTFRRGLSRLRA